MKAHVKTRHGTFEAEGNTTKELFKKVAAIQEVFSEEKCNLCESTSIRMVAREVDGVEFFEYRCDCGAVLSMGQSKTKQGELFPNRKLLPNGKPDFKKGNFGKHRGWTKYRGDNKDDG